MVAFELAQFHEKAGETAEAVRWFTTACERFRRPQWKQKAEEALTRLGAPIPAHTAGAPVVAVSESTAEPGSAPIIAEFSDEQPDEETEEVMTEGQQETVFEQPPVAAAPAPQPAEGGTEHRRRRRGRRGGRGRHKGARAGAPALAPAPAAAPPPPPSMFDRFAEPGAGPSARAATSPEVAEPRMRESEPAPSRSHDASAASHSGASRVRSGDPALSSRMTQLESQLRRLLACGIRSLEQADEAPAGPGVFLITDTDQTTYYYAEACQTLRVGIANMLRSGRGSREGANVKETLAEHLGINEARVGKYLKDHCGVRWLQLDEGAPLLAHFAVAVLRPISNE
jgi:hypothetical protein